jgi:tRNA(fMet)-specific endonuclease VapC
MILLDSTFLVDLLRQNSFALEWLDTTTEYAIYTTEINRFEIYLGLFSLSKGKKSKSAIARTTDIENLFTRLYTLPFDRKSAIESAYILSKLRSKGKQIEIRDAMVAGISLANGISKIVTRNRKHFKRIDRIDVITY